MPRIRSIKPGFFTNDSLAEVHPLGRLLFSGLWCHADRAGRLEDRPRKLKAEILPYDDCNIDDLLDALAARGFVIRYNVAGVRYLQVVNFDKHQTPNIKEIDSIIPAPASTVPAQYEHSTGDIPESHLTVLGTVTDQEQVQEQSWEGVQGEAARGGGASAPRTRPAPLPVPRFPKPKDAPPRENPLWDALVAGIGVTPATSSERSLFGKVVGELGALGATPDDVLRRCAHYREAWPNVSLTPTALMKHWSGMEHPPPRDKLNGRHQPGLTARNLAALKEAF